MNTCSYRCLILFVCFVFQTCLLLAQTTMEWDDFVQDLYERYAEQHEDIAEDEGLELMDGSFEVLLEDLNEIHLSPINLNGLKTQEGTNDVQAHTIERLAHLTFLTRTQIDAIVDYVNTNYPVCSLGELMMIRQLDYLTRTRLMLFCYAGQPSSNENLSIRRLLRYASHEIIARTDIPLYTKDGYHDKPGSVIEGNPNKVYQGNNNYHSLRYQMNAMHCLTAGFQTEKDAGEDWMDYVSGYVMLNHIGKIRTLIVGDYKLSFGQGLIVNNNMSFGKSSGWGLFDNAALSHGIRKHASMSETNHFRGAAIDYALGKNTHFTAFLSYQNVDGTRRTDRNNAVSSLKTDGLHRTLLERSKKGILQEWSGGGNISYFHKGLMLELTGIVTHYSMPLAPKYNTTSSLYRQFYPQGTSFSAVGVSYNYRNNRWTLQGEYAFSTSNGVQEAFPILGTSRSRHPNNGIAVLNSLRYEVNSNTCLSALVRWYDAHYATIYSNAFGEGSRPQNEYGLFVGIASEPWTRVRFEAYLDCFKFPERSYRASAGAQGVDGQIKINYTPSERTTWQLRYHMKSKQQDAKIGKDVTRLYYSTRHDVRFQWNYRLNDDLLLKTTATGVYRFNATMTDETGFSLTQHLRWEHLKKPTGGKRRADLAVTYFNTDSYAARVYTNEPSLLYALGMTSLFYHGIKVVALFSTNITDCLSVTGKISATKYFNRDTIGTGLELIDASHKEDVQLQLRWKL